VHAIGDMADLIERIETPEGVSRHHENLWRLGRVGSQYQVHGAGNIGFDAHGLDLGVFGGGVMVWGVFTGTVAGPGFLAGDYVGASGEASLGVGVGANVLVGGSNRTVTLQPVSVSGQVGINIAVGVASIHLGLPRR